MSELEIAPRQARGAENFVNLGGVVGKAARRFSHHPTSPKLKSGGRSR
jgi:hypothetical protein